MDFTSFTCFSYYFLGEIVNLNVDVFQTPQRERSYKFLLSHLHTARCKNNNNEKTNTKQHFVGSGGKESEWEENCFIFSNFLFEKK